MTNISNNADGAEESFSSRRAEVRSVEQIARFAAGVREFEQDARGALISLDQQLQRALEWIDHEQPLYWKRQIQLQYEQVARARSALENCQLREVAGERPACIEEEQDLRYQKQKLQRLLDKPEEIRRWAIKFHREADEFRARTSGLRQCLDGDLPQMLGLLERTVAILEAYAEGGPSELEE